MSKLSKETQLRNEGMTHIMNLLEAGHSMEEIREEVKRRGAYHVPLVLTKAEEQEYCNRVKNTAIRLVCLLSLQVLHDEFGFGNQYRDGQMGRLDRFRKRFNTITACISDEYLTWEELERTLIEENGMGEIFSSSFGAR